MFDGLICHILKKRMKKTPLPVHPMAEKILLELSSSPTTLDAKNIKKIHRKLPVPSDFDILWAEILEFGNHPAGVVITNRALILKAPKSEIKKANREIKKEN